MKSAIVIGLLGAMTTLYLSTFHMPVNYNDNAWDQEFLTFVTKFSKNYESNDMYAARREVFKANFMKIDSHNR
jgi:C1A family cysteine protease